MNRELISVVMPVYNGAEKLAKSIQSILDQRDVLMEIIIVDDGSTDQSEEIIRGFMERDSRIKLIKQTNQGITKALIEGCRVATGTYIARQDNGDISLPNRLSLQRESLHKNPCLVLSSTAVETVAPDGEVVFIVSQTKSEASDGLRKLSVDTITGPPHHGSVMFRKEVYEKVGGYRAEFIVAQDLDLWTRMIELGDHYSLPKVLYRAFADKNSISSTRREQQIETTHYIIECCLARKAYGSDALIVGKLRDHNNSTSRTAQASKSTDSAFYYFIGSNLRKTNPSASKKYLRMSLSSNPFNVKAWLKLLH